MSGDVQPRKRKDKKKKRDDEASHGVHLTKMGSDDVHLHVHQEHGTGGHWCAKVIFFSLMTVLLGLVCLIILENRGISDVDTPLSESRFSNYFDGWVDEHRADDHHGDVHGSPEDDHDDEHDEPLEEEADVSEGDEADEDENVTQEEAEEADDEDEDENVTAEEEEDDNVTAEDDNVTAEDDNVTAEEEEDENATAEEDENVTAEEDENVTAEEEDDNVTLEATNENIDDDEEDEEEDDNNTNEDNVDDNATRETSKHASMNNDEDDDDPFDDDEEDGNFDSVENIVDNDGSELELLKEKARQQAAAEAKSNPASDENLNNDEDTTTEQASSWASSLTLKIGVGLALALVARLVLLKKNPITNHDDPDPEILMKRRLTIASPEEVLPEDPNEVEEFLPEDEFSEEEIEIEEEIEYIDDIEEDPPAEENEVDAGNNDYMPETFEQLNAMYRPKGYQDDEYNDNRTQTNRTEPDTYRSPYQTSINTTETYTNKAMPAIVREEPIVNTTRSNTLSQIPHKAPAVFEAPPPPPLVEARIDAPKFSPPRSNDVNEYYPHGSDDVNKYSPPRVSVPKYSPPRAEVDDRQMEEPKSTKKDVTYDMDYQPEDDDIDYDEDDIYDDEGHDDDSEELDDDDLDDEDDDEEGEEEDLSDVDDTELMNRLEAKYGKLPAKEYETDEDPDDPTWTQIKPKTGGGAQSYDDDDGIDVFEQELRRANEEMMREFNYH